MSSRSRPPISDPAEPLDLGGQPALATVPAGARALLLCAHGAGAGMRHHFFVELATALAERDVATVRWDLPYMAAGRKRPDPPAICHRAVVSVAAAAAARWPTLARFAGGKSFGGRMTSQAAALGHDLGVRGLVFLGFPLHPAPSPGQVATDPARADHLARIALSMLLVQGSRDALADPRLMVPVVAGLGARATFVEIAAADHGFEVLVRSGRTGAEVMAEVATTVAAWMLARAG